MELFPILIIAVVLVLIVLGAIFGGKPEEERREQLLSLATRLGWSFDPEKDHDHRHRFEQFPAFKRGDSSRHAYNRMAGVWRAGPTEDDAARFECLAGDYHYVTKSTDSDGDTKTTTHRFSYLLVRLPFAARADLRVRPENWGDRLGAFFGFDDIDFESAEFSKRFHVTGADKRFVYDVIHPRMMDFLLATRPGAFEVDGGWLCVTSGGQRWRPEEFEPRLRWAGEFLSHWPRHLLQNTARTDGSQDA